MIIDAHAHIFSTIAGQRGKEKTSPGKFGKILIGNNVDQTLPPFFTNSLFRAEMLVNMMDYAGVDKAVILQNPFYGIINEEIAEAVKSYPDRFIGTIQVDPMSESALETIKKFISPGHSILKFELSEGWGWSGIYPGLMIDSKHFTRIWELANELKLEVIIDPGSIHNAGYQIEQLDKISNRYPDIKFLLEHLGYLTHDLIHNEKSRLRRLELINLAKKENIFLGFSATNILLDEDYPCSLSLELLHEAVSLVGIVKILWGSDIPSTLGKYTYRQMIDVVLKHASFLTDIEKDNILGTNALAFFRDFNSKIH